MATERQPPDAVLDSANYTTLNLVDVDEDPDSPDGSWGAWDGNGNTSARFSFATPTGPPTVGADLQEFRVQIRKSAAGGATTTWSLQLWENGSQVAVLNTGTTTSTTGEVVSGTWNANQLATSDGSLVECRLEQTGGGTGGGRKGVEVGAVEWNVDYTAAQDISPSKIAATGSVPTGAQLDLVLTATKIAATGSVPNPTVTPGAVDISPSLYAPGTTFQLPRIAFVVSPALVAAGTSIPGPALTTGPVDISPGAIAGAPSVPSPALTVGAVDISPGAIAAGTVIPGPTLTTTYSITASAIAASPSVPNPSLSVGAVDISPTKIAAATTVHGPDVGSGGTTVYAIVLGLLCDS